MSRQGAKFAKAERISQEDFSSVFMVFKPQKSLRSLRLSVSPDKASFAPWREERSLCGVISQFVFGGC
jgi:hypothetical protein